MFPFVGFFAGADESVIPRAPGGSVEGVEFEVATFFLIFSARLDIFFSDINVSHVIGLCDVFGAVLRCFSAVLNSSA